MDDEVDEIVAGWLDARTSLTPQVLMPLHILSRIHRIAQLAADRRAAIFAEYELGQHEFDVLAALRRSPGPHELTPGQLMEATHVTSGTMTNRLDRLERRQFVTRRSHPTDGRQSLIRLSPVGRRRLDAAMDSLLAWEHELVAALGQREHASLIRSLRTLLVAGAVLPESPTPASS
ncbi:MAG: MarR family transcriptional regulator [Frankiales bacterium]|nr:MarR family transcriptional regulator [Frankiales bacterium]